MGKRTPARQRDATEDRLVSAVGTLLARDGFAALGVNAVAREAGVDKVLVYRYFGGLEQLLHAYGLRGDHWWTVEELLDPRLPPPARDLPGAWCAVLLRRHADALRRRPQTLEIMAWENVERNALTTLLEDVREQRSRELVARVQERFPGASLQHFPDLMAVLSAGVSYLLVRARHVRWYGGVDLSAHEGWQRLFDSATLALEAMDMSPVSDSRSRT